MKNVKKIINQNQSKICFIDAIFAKRIYVQYVSQSMIIHIILLIMIQKIINVKYIMKYLYHIVKTVKKIYVAYVEITMKIMTLINI